MITHIKRNMSAAHVQLDSVYTHNSNDIGIGVNQLVYIIKSCILSCHVCICSWTTRAGLSASAFFACNLVLCLIVRLVYQKNIKSQAFSHDPTKPNMRIE